jgi:aminoglycoside phosphotransferase (APT) family kinase protein
MSEANEVPEGIDGEKVGAWLEANVAGASGPFSYERIAGGRSNLTYRVTDSDGREWALRRPPLGKALGSAHDMGREHRVVSALAPTPVPVAPIAGYCTDEAVNGAPFYVMEFVAGPILRLRADAEGFDEAGRRAIGKRVVDNQVEIPPQVPDQIGHGEHGQ